MKTKSAFAKVLRDNYHWIAFGIFVVLMLILHRFILMTGDDYMHSWVIDGSASEFWGWHVHHYLRGNGRALIHFFLTILFALPNAELHRILNPFVFAFLLWMEAKICSEDQSQSRKSFVILCLIFLGLFGEFMSMGIYSFTPAFNYMHPLLLTFGVVLCTRRLYAGQIDSKGFYVFYWLISLLAGASMEQSGIMTIGYLILIGFFGYMKQRRMPPRAVWIALCLAVAGYLTVMLAPGNFVRMENSTKPFLENFVAASTMLINTRSFALFQVVFVFCMVYWLLSLKAKNKLVFGMNICICIGLAVGNLTNLFLLFNPFGFSLESGGLFGLIWRGYDLLYIFSAVYVPLWIALRKQDWSYAVHMCIALGSVFILLFASVSPYRPLIPAVMTTMLFMTKTLLAASRKTTARGAVFGFLAVMAVFSFGLNLHGYYVNYAADEKNKQAIAAYHDAENGELHLYPYGDAMAAGYSVCTPGAVYPPEMNDTEMYLGLYKTFYGIPEETTLVFDLE